MEHLALWSSDFPPLSYRNTKGATTCTASASIMKFYHYITFNKIIKGNVSLNKGNVAIILQRRKGYGGTAGTAGSLHFF